jgi:hypothetical protein
MIRADLTCGAEAGAQGGGDGRAAGATRASAFGCGARLDVVARWQRGERGVERGTGALVQLQTRVPCIAHAHKMRGHDAVMLACYGRTGPSVSRRHGRMIEHVMSYDRKSLFRSVVLALTALSPRCV